MASSEAKQLAEKRGPLLVDATGGLKHESAKVIARIDKVRVVLRMLLKSSIRLRRRIRADRP